MKINPFALAPVAFACTAAFAQVSNDQVRYDLVDPKGMPLHSVEAAHGSPMVIRQTRPDGSTTDFRVPEFDKLRKQHDFEFDLLDESLLSTPQGDYFVVESMRSIAMNPEEDTDYVRHPSWWEHRCDHGVRMTYLLGVVKDRIKIVERHFTPCAADITVFDSGGQAGYVIKSRRGDYDETVVYRLQENGRFIMTETGLSTKAR